MRRVRKVVDTHVHPGMNPEHRVRLVLEPGRTTEYDPFLMLAEDWFVPGTFGDHPHRGFETVTYVLEGSVEHRDNHGGHGVLHPGDAQWMTAGRGVVHSEEAGPNGAHSLQLWVNLPRALKMSEPRYQDLRGDEMPVRRFEGGEARVFAPSKPLTPITMIDVRMDAGATFSQPLPASDNCFVYIISGSTTDAGATQVIWFQREEGDVTLRANEPTHAILWSGPAINEPVAARGPFVMNTFDEVAQAYHDFRTGKF